MLDSGFGRWVVAGKYRVSGEARRKDFRWCMEISRDVTPFLLKVYF